MNTFYLTIYMSDKVENTLLKILFFYNLLKMNLIPRDNKKGVVNRFFIE